jgi:hypothetical protein
LASYQIIFDGLIVAIYCIGLVEIQSLVIILYELIPWGLELCDFLGDIVPARKIFAQLHFPASISNQLFNLKYEKGKSKSLLGHLGTLAAGCGLKKSECYSSS